MTRDYVAPVVQIHHDVLVGVRFIGLFVILLVPVDNAL